MRAINEFSRRAFLGSAAALAVLRKAGADRRQPTKAIRWCTRLLWQQAGIQLGTQLPASASDDDMQFTRQLGVEWVMTSLPPSECKLETTRR